VRFAWYGPWLMMLLLLIEIEECEEIDADDTSPSFGMVEPNKKKYGNVNEANDVSE